MISRHCASKRGRRARDDRRGDFKRVRNAFSVTIDYQPHRDRLFLSLSLSLSSHANAFATERVHAPPLSLSPSPGPGIAAFQPKFAAISGMRESASSPRNSENVTTAISLVVPTVLQSSPLSLSLCPPPFSGLSPVLAPLRDEFHYCARHVHA